jgi:hypothetical protein
LKASSRTRLRGTRDTARAQVSALFTSSIVWVPWRALPARRLSRLRAPAPAAQGGAAEVVAVEGFLGAGLAAVAAVRSRAAKIDEQKQNLTMEARRKPGQIAKIRRNCQRLIPSSVSSGLSRFKGFALCAIAFPRLLSPLRHVCSLRFTSPRDVPSRGEPREPLCVSISA